MDNYVLKRNSLKLLSEFILDREYFSIMMAYVADVDNLKVVMCALRVAAPNIQFEAFHVFKVFVANPQKTPKIAAILTANKLKLVHFLEGFQNDKGAAAAPPCGGRGQRPAPPPPSARTHWRSRSACAWQRTSS